ncbi:MAG: sodium:proton antiporter [bacterium]|nr:sodium:proton antiporter [bacterium]
MTFEWWSIIPFVIMLGGIAVFPLVHSTAHIWERRGIQLAFALILGVPIALWLWFGGAQLTVVHTLWEYTQFIILLFALYVVSGGIFLKGDIEATPRNNATFMAIGGVLASFIGTTGAAMLLIRPILNTNKERTHRVHTVVFFIFIVANCGGLLTPLGDPPLFMGFLSGVPFTWTFGLWPMWLFVNAILLITFLALDVRLYRTEPVAALVRDQTNIQPLGIRGGINFAFLAMIVLAVAFIPSLDLHAIETGTATFTQMIPWRELVMLTAAALSFVLTSKSIRYGDNEFEWGPIAEVAALFIGIFLTMMPALKFLAQVAPSLPLNAPTFYGFSGTLSAVLDNTPTYLTFFEMAKELPGDPRVGNVPEAYLVAISLGSVFFGAMTYIGNGPNFMVKAVADSRGVTMPSFLGYVVWSARYLLPTLIAVMFIFVFDSTWALIVGLVIAAALVGQAVWTLLQKEAPVAQDQQPVGT